MLLDIDSRYKKFVSQLKGAFFFKLLAISISFLTVPLALEYLGESKYGIWATVLSMMSWVLILDLGLGNGLRNKVTEVLSGGEHNMKSKEYISTAYIAVSIVCFFLILVFNTVVSYVPWNNILNTVDVSVETLKLMMGVSFSFILINFSFSLVNQVAHGIQFSSLVVFSQFFSSFILLLLLIFLIKFTSGNLVYIAWIYGVSQLVSNIGVSVWFYRRRPELTPSVFYFNISRLKEMFSLSVRFFVIQIAAVILFSTDRFIVIQLFDPKDVVNLDVALKLFSAITIIHGVIVTPLWPAYSDAYHRKDYCWLNSMLKKQTKVFFLVTIMTLFLFLFSNHIFDFWLGGNFEIKFELIASVALFVTIQVWNNVYAVFLNAVNKLKLQMYTSIFALIFNIPLSIFFVKYLEFGVYGVILGTIVTLFAFSILGPIEVHKILAKKVTLDKSPSY